MSSSEEALQASPRTGDACISGWLDTGVVDDGYAPIRWRPAGDGVEFYSPMMLIRTNGRVQWHAHGPALTLVNGEPRIDNKRATPAEVQALLEPAPNRADGLRGRFAIVHFDAASRRAWLFSDRFATHPLCWAVDGTRLNFSDRADSVPGDVPREIDWQAVYNYLYFHVIPAPRTVFRGVHRLEPSTALQLSQSGLSQTKTWSPHFAPHVRAHPDGMQGRFMALLQASVEREVTTKLTGAFLSGGTDSSTVTGLLCRATGGGAPTFSIGFDADGYDEAQYARITAQHFGSRHHEYYVTPRDLCQGIPLVAAHYDQPFGNSSAVPAYFCASVARDHGVEKLLAGDGGDELFGGNRRYSKQKVFEMYMRLPASLRARLIEPVVALPGLDRLPLLRKAASYVRQARIPMPARMETYNLLAQFGAAAVVAPALLDAVDVGEPARLQQSIYARVSDAGLVDRMLAYDWRFTLADNDLVKVIGTSQMAGVDVGFPLLDDDIVDFSLALGVDDKVHGLKLRRFFKEALTGFLPHATIVKKKHGFGLPVGPWLLRDGNFRDLARASLEGLARRGIIRRELVDDAFSNRLTEHAGYYGEMIWILIMLEQWFEAHTPRVVGISTGK